MQNKDYWQGRYRAGQTGWDVGYATPPITEYADQLTDKSLRILIPGCGNAYEGEYLMRRGFENTFLIDLVPEVLEGVRNRFPEFPAENLICGDFFELTGSYDLILEQTFFCALDPVLRPQYVRQVYQLLNAGGRLAGVLFNRPFDKPGPPFGGSRKEYQELFSSQLCIRTLAPCYNSIKPRLGSEDFIICEKPED